MGEQGNDKHLVLDGIPVEVAENVPHLLSRVNAYLSYFAAMNLNRLDNIYRYMVEAEKRLYNLDELSSLSDEELSRTYRSAKSASMEILEFARKISVQIQDQGKEVDEVVNLLRSLSPSELSKLKESLESLDDK